MKTWKIEYEIPPLRAIYCVNYCAETDADTKSEVLAQILNKEPSWRIRKIEPCSNCKAKPTEQPRAN